MKGVVDVSIARVELYNLLRDLARNQGQSLLSLILINVDCEYFVVVWL